MSHKCEFAFGSCMIFVKQRDCLRVSVVIVCVVGGSQKLAYTSIHIHTYVVYANYDKRTMSTLVVCSINIFVTWLKQIYKYVCAYVNVISLMRKFVCTAVLLELSPKSLLLPSTRQTINESISCRQASSQLAASTVTQIMLK